jgi:TolB-like protein/DNA-binding winged helix-turn-helix (wHTH) protein/Tfp pilus assembly protein PilF
LFEATLSARSYRFEEFELDGARFELRRNGRALKLERLPLELLMLLAEKNGDVVTRQEIIDRLWGKDVFVDTEHGINTAIRKIRAALRDDVERSRYIQTVSGKGYRFVAKLKNGNGSASMFDRLPETKAPASAIPVQPKPTPAQVAQAAEKQPTWRLAAIATLVLLLIAAGVFGFNIAGLRDRVFAKSKIGPIHSIAVLPLANLSGDPSEDYYADGMTDEVITALAQNPALRIVSRTSTMQFKGVNKPLREIAQALGVDGILEGSVVRNADHVHMNLQLIYAPTDTHLWAKSYNRDLNGATSLPEELSDTIASVAKVASRPARQLRYVNPEAHDAYLRGRYLWVAGNYGESQKYFEKAIQLQPGYAPGWSGLSDSILAKGVGQAPARGLVDKAEAAAGKAIELDDNFAEGHHAMAAVYLFGKWDWDRADAESRRSLELDPNFSEAHHLHSYILFAMNRVQEALQEQKRATEIDPFERPWALGRAYYRVRQYDAALEEFRMRAQAGSAALWVHYFLSKVYGFKGMEEESVQEMEENTRINLGEKAAAEIHRANERGGRRAVLQLRLDDLKARSRKDYVSPFDLAEAYSDLGMKDEALRELGDAYGEHSMDLVFLQQEPNFDFMHSDQRYRALVKKIGLVPAY